MRALLAAALVLVSCATIGAGGGRPLCVTPCGMTSTEGDCEALQRFEGRALHLLSLRVFEFNEARMCRALKGWRVETHRIDPIVDKGCAPEGWRLFPGFCAAGYTHLDTQVIELSNTQWETNALAHELAHVADRDLTGKVGHCRWSDPGLRIALEDLTGSSDPSEPEPACDAGTPDAGRF